MRESYCKESEQISEYLEGHLDGEKIREIAAHLKSCSTCAATLRDLQSLKSLLNNAETPSVPPNKEFWANAYRNARLSVRETPPSRSSLRWGSLLNRQAASWTAAAALCLLISISVADKKYHPTDLPASINSSSEANVVDVGPLIRSHTSYTAMQPLTDDPRISMILSDEAASKDEEANATLP